MGTLAERKQSTCYLINRLCYSFSVCVPVYSFVVHVCFAGPDPDGDKGVETPSFPIGVVL